MLVRWARESSDRGKTQNAENRNEKNRFKSYLLFKCNCKQNVIGSHLAIRFQTREIHSILFMCARVNKDRHRATWL